MKFKISNVFNNLNELQILYSALGLCVVVAYFSVGFHHFDEHFQIIEFMNFKLGRTSSEELPWEFHQRMRPWFQPYLYLVLDTPLRLMDFSPFTRVFFLRLYSGVFFILSLFLFYKNVVSSWFKENPRLQRRMLILMLFTWYIPYVAVRPSAESISISLFLLGSSLTLGSKSRTFLGSLAFGLSYLCRYQMALPIAVLWFWAGIKNVWSIRKLSIFASGIILMILLGLTIDSYGYNQFTFALYNYFKANFLDGVLKQMGEDPWYKYFEWSLVKLIPPISLALIVGVLLFWKKEIKSDKSWITWITLSFILFHSAIGHKEYRFIFLCAVLAPIMSAHSIRRKIPTFFIGLNIILVLITLKPANKMIPLYKYIYNQDIETLYYVDEDPKKLVGLPLNFYLKKTLSTIELGEQSKKNKLIFTKRFNSTKRFLENGCEPNYLNYPIQIFDDYSPKIMKFLKKQKVMGIFKC